MKILEYMAMKKAVVAPKLGPIEDIIEEDVDGLLFEVGDSWQFSQKLSKVLKGYFLKDDYTVFTAYNGEEALDIFYSKKIDLVILDWMMPMKDGIAVCREIKENSDAKVLILTAKSEF